LLTGGDILTDIAGSPDEKSRDIVSRRVNLTVQNLIGKLRGIGRKRKGFIKRKQKGDKKPKLTKEMSSPK